MEDKLRRYVDGLFARSAPTKRAVELKEEMLQNLNDKYSDLISEGKAPEAAYNIAIAGIGDVSGLLAELETEIPELDESYIAELEVSRHRSAMITSIAVMMYIVCALPIIILAIAGSAYAASIGVPAMFIIIAAATGLLIYNSMTKPKYIKGSDSMVEEFREWQSDMHASKALRRAISSALWAIIVALYFIISFWSHAWHLTWVIFLLGAAAEAFINLFFTMKK